MVKRLTGKQDVRVLTQVERRLADYLDNERQAIALAQFVDTDFLYEDQVPAAVMKAFIKLYEKENGKLPMIEYTGGIRRDTLRREK